jgi:hypothetical protein
MIGDQLEFKQKTGIIKYEIGTMNVSCKRADGTIRIIPIYMVVDEKDHVVRGFDGKPYASCIRKDVDRMKKNLERENLENILMDQKIAEIKRLRESAGYDSLFLRSH